MRTSILFSLAFCQFVSLVLSGTLPEVTHASPCDSEDHNTVVTTSCLAPLDKYDTVAELRAVKTSCQIHEDIENCVKAKGGLCKGQGKELYGVSGIFEKACKNPEDEETLWRFFSEVLGAGPEIEHQLELAFSHCLEESTLNFFDFAKLLFSDESDEDDFELDPSKLLEGIYVCGISSVAKTLHLNILSLDRLAKGFLEYSGLESAEKLEVCKTKLALPTELCSEADKCLRNDDHNDDISLKCFDEFDRDVTDYSVFKGTDKSRELYNKVNECIQHNGGFCEDQSELGPALLNVFKYVSEHEQDGNVWWDLLTKFEAVSDEDERKFENSFVHCLNESNAHFLNPQHLSLQSFNQLEDYVEALYVCLVASLADTFHANYQSVGRLSNAFIEKLGFEVDEVQFCGHPLSLPTALCAAH